MMQNLAVNLIPVNYQKFLIAINIVQYRIEIILVFR